MTYMKSEAKVGIQPHDEKGSLDLFIHDHVLCWVDENENVYW